MLTNLYLIKILNQTDIFFKYTNERQMTNINLLVRGGGEKGNLNKSQPTFQI